MLIQEPLALAAICSLLDHTLNHSGLKTQLEMEFGLLKWVFHLLEASEVLTGKNLAQQIEVNFYFLLHRSLSLSPQKDENPIILVLIDILRKLLPSTFADSTGIPFCAFSSFMYFLHDPNSEILSEENIQAANSVCLNSQFPLNLPSILLLLQPTPQVFRTVLTFLTRSSISIDQKILLEGENLEKLSKMSGCFSTKSRNLSHLCKSLKDEGQSFEVTPLSLASLLNLPDHCKILIDEGASPETVFI